MLYRCDIMMIEGAKEDDLDLKSYCEKLSQKIYNLIIYADLIMNRTQWKQSIHISCTN